MHVMYHDNRKTHRIFTPTQKRKEIFRLVTFVKMREGLSGGNGREVKVTAHGTTEDSRESKLAGVVPSPSDSHSMAFIHRRVPLFCGISSSWCW